jgi:hypothetical protein
MREGGPTVNGIRHVAVALVAAVALTGCSVTTSGTATPVHTATPSPGAAAAPSVTTAPSDEDAAAQTVKAFGDAYNSQNWEAYVELMCAPMRAKFTGVVMDYLKKDRVRAGPTTVSGITIKIDGDAATAFFDGHNEALGTKRVSIPLKREEDGWKVCQL